MLLGARGVARELVGQGLGLVEEAEGAEALGEGLEGEGDLGGLLARLGQELADSLGGQEGRQVVERVVALGPALERGDDRPDRAPAPLSQQRRQQRGGHLTKVSTLQMGREPPPEEVEEGLDREHVATVPWAKRASPLR